MTPHCSKIPLLCILKVCQPDVNSLSVTICPCYNFSYVVQQRDIYLFIELVSAFIIYRTYHVIQLLKIYELHHPYLQYISAMLVHPHSGDVWNSHVNHRNRKLVHVDSFNSLRHTSSINPNTSPSNLNYATLLTRLLPPSSFAKSELYDHEHSNCER